MDLKKTFREKYYVLICFAVMAAAQLICYYIPKAVLGNMTLTVMDTAIDRSIPLIPCWVIVYVLAYLSWVVSGIIILWDSREHARRIASAYVLAMIICGICFVAFPITMQRPELTGSGFCMDLLRAIYSADTPLCLCPSLHVLISYICWRGLSGCGRVPRWFKLFNFVFFVLVCFSVVFVKQHLFMDIPAGIAAGELAMQISRFVGPGRAAKQ